MWLLLSIFTYSYLLIYNVESAKILCVFPSPSFSHQVVFRPIVNELANRGHELIVLTPDPQKNTHQNVREIDLSSAYQVWNVTMMTKKMSKYNIMKELKDIFDMVDNVIDYELSLPEVKSLINSDEKFDLVFIEYLFPSMLGFPAKFKCPFVGIISADAPTMIHDVMGNPTNPIAYPDFQLPFKTPMSFFERIIAVIFRIFSEIFGQLHLIPKQNEIIRKHFGNEIESIEKIAMNLSILFLNTNPILHTIRPLGPNTIQIGGGTQITPLKTLPANIKNFMDKSENGVIYFSLGTNVKSDSLKPEFLKIFLETFQTLPYDILWKFDIDIPELPKNVKLIKWGPQQDILRHPKVKLFIMQGGLQSMEESIFSQVPMIAIPFFGDQEGNARIIHDKEIGVKLDKNTIDKQILTDTIQKIIQNPKYKDQVKKIAELLADQQVTGVDKAVWWIEYVIRHKGAYHLRNNSYNLPWYQYYFLDVLSVIIVVITVPLYAIYRIFNFLIRKLTGRVKVKVQ